MFGLAAGIYQSYFAPQQLNILLIGEENTGKTTLLERIKVTETSSRSRNMAAARLRTAIACPAPKKYKPEHMTQEEEEEEATEAHPETGAAAAAALTRNDSNTNDESSRSLEDIPLTSDTSTTMAVAEETLQEHNVKPGARMLPLDKIRPTIGMNMAKTDLCGIKCRIWDVGGKMQDLWERYYDDADAVIYCMTTTHHAILLEQVRLDIEDDTPFLVFWHVMDDDNRTEQEGGGTSAAATTTSTSLDELLPHYHSNMMELHVGSAKSGEGVREALEWLIPLAGRQKQLRQVPPETKY